MMLKPLLTRLLHHLLAQNSWAMQQLQPFGGKHARLLLPPFSVTLAVLEDGGLAIAGETADTDATITVPPSVALRMLAGDESAGTAASVSGDTEFAAALASVLQDMSWEYEEDLSRIIGDAPAHEAAKLGRAAVSHARRQAANVAGMLAEYWQEEQPLIAKKRHIEQFMRDVDTLREDAERLQKRIDKLKSRLQADQ
ncbi:SCP2 sterol-binding domain-containing protein [Methylobacillus sp.]|uniref:ubiquinone biosynthesis accessory factor UbiJ n=1 Tax=Methylobacillus sp. TaxID=56818 RepID=UPI00257E6FA8|nr:SCP2 sterol-binding domain-containing protein [Methylobacillus sp.]